MVKMRGRTIAATRSPPREGRADTCHDRGSEAGLGAAPQAPSPVTPSGVCSAGTGGITQVVERANFSG